MDATSSFRDFALVAVHLLQSKLNLWLVAYNCPFFNNDAELCELSMLLTKDQMFKGYLCSHSKPTTLVNNIIGRIILLPEIMPSSNYRCVDTKLQHHAAW